MKDLFVPYTQALELKELGFDEPCFAFYNTKVDESLSFVDLFGFLDEKIIDDYYYNSLGLYVSAPTFSQAFNFLLEKYNLYAVIVPTVTTHWTFKTMTIANGMIDIPPYKNVDGNDYSSFKETELACLIKLIEIVKNK